MPGTMSTKIVPMLEAELGRRAGRDFDIAYVPHFAALGRVVRDFQHPPFLLVGSDGGAGGPEAATLFRRTVDSRDASPHAVRARRRIGENRSECISLHEGLVREFSRPTRRSVLAVPISMRSRTRSRSIRELELAFCAAAPPLAALVCPATSTLSFIWRNRSALMHHLPARPPTSTPLSTTLSKKRCLRADRVAWPCSGSLSSPGRRSWRSRSRLSWCGGCTAAPSGWLPLTRSRRRVLRRAKCSARQSLVAIRLRNASPQPTRLWSATRSEFCGTCRRCSGGSADCRSVGLRARPSSRLDPAWPRPQAHILRTERGSGAD